MRNLTVLTLVLAASAASAAELYRWVDKDGVVHYDDKAHPQAKYIIVNSSNGPGLDAAAIARAAECRKQQADLDLYRNATGLQQVDALGNKKDLTDQERLQLLDLQEKKVKDACGAVPPPTAAKAPPAAATSAPP